MDQVRLEHLVNQFYDDTGNIFPVKCFWYMQTCYWESWWVLKSWEKNLDLQNERQRNDGNLVSKWNISYWLWCGDLTVWPANPEIYLFQARVQEILNAKWNKIGNGLINCLKQSKYFKWANNYIFMVDSMCVSVYNEILAPVRTTRAQN